MIWEKKQGFPFSSIRGIMEEQSFFDRAAAPDTKEV